jgi:branched-chain amino acid transport system substrate-binding protein
MQSARQCSALFVVAAALSACRSGPPKPLTLGMAYPPWAQGFVTVAESTMAADWPDSVTRPRILLDHDSLPERVERTVEWTQLLLADPSVRVVVGPSASHTAIATAPLVNAATIPMIVPSATARQLAQAGPWVFRMAGDDSTEGAFIVQQILRRPGLRRVLILYVNDEYGQGLRAGLAEELSRTGLRPTSEIPVDQRSDFETLFRSEFVSRRPDVIIGAFRNPELAAAAKALRRLGSRIPIFVGDGAFGPLVFYEQLGDPPFTVYGAALWLPDPADSVARVYRERFRRILGRVPRPEDAMIHDAIMLAATAMVEGHGDPHEMRRWLLALGVTAPPYAGVTGPIDFRADRPRAFRFGRFVHDTAVDAEIR